MRLKEEHGNSRTIQDIFQRNILMKSIYYRAVDIGGIKISYREAGRPDAPTLLLLHGFQAPGTCSAI
jgi:hypothetical protein